MQVMIIFNESMWWGTELKHLVVMGENLRQYYIVSVEGKIMSKVLEEVLHPDSLERLRGKPPPPISVLK